MKLLVLLLLLGTATFGQNTPGYFSVQVNMPETYKGRYMYLTYRYFDSSGIEKTDSQLLLSGKLIFRGSVYQPAPASIHLRLGFPTETLPAAERARFAELFPGNKMEIPFDFFLVPGETVITVKKSMLAAEIDGPGEVIDFEKLKQAKNAVTEEMMLLFEELLDCRLSGNEQCSTEVTGKLRNAQRKIQNDIYLNYYKRNRSSSLALYALEESIPGKLDSAAVYLEYLSELPGNMRAMPQAILLKNLLEEYHNSDPGKYVKDFELSDTAGNPVTLKSFAGRYVLLDFWTTATLAKKLSHPDFLPVWNKFGSKNFSIMSIALLTPAGKSEWMSYIKKNNMPWTHVTDYKGRFNPAAQHLGIITIPFNLLIDPAGKILLRNANADELVNFLDRVID